LASSSICTTVIRHFASARYFSLDHQGQFVLRCCGPPVVEIISKSALAEMGANAVMPAGWQAARQPIRRHIRAGFRGLCQFAGRNVDGFGVRGVASRHYLCLNPRMRSRYLRGLDYYFMTPARTGVPFR